LEQGFSGIMKTQVAALEKLATEITECRSMEVFSKTRFQQAYQIAMAEQDPKMYRQMMAAKTLKEHLRETAEAALTLYQETENRLREEQGMGDQAKFIAAEIVFAEMIQFSKPENLLEKLFKLD
jgi:hypothetical protein